MGRRAGRSRRALQGARPSGLCRRAQGADLEGPLPGPRHPLGPHDRSPLRDGAPAARPPAGRGSSGDARRRGHCRRPLNQLPRPPRRSQDAESGSQRRVKRARRRVQGGQGRRGGGPECARYQSDRRPQDRRGRVGQTGSVEW
ncbi:hypothetical protein BU14_0072s0035 [Porphyra umbilicalis]|uniref:Uncharacterized protein n=1 Tax=Porphyra umbilicalis TaxID=2786 RepID=A0A1X6PFQ1_PORUM|nr:hypothetical protein BU14_0072s0035 [Porphyra umbilicalis]|eukprot:OSX79677.1 hypothetical protein BU14_0072s0035 [Porphyra umbilicalis]